MVKASRKFPALVALVMALSFTPTASEATIVVPLTIEQMQSRSNTIVRAVVLDSNSEWDRSEKHIFTYTRLKVLEAFKGKQSVGEIIRIRTLGGEVGDVGMAVAGTAKFQASEEVVIFGRTDRYDAANFQVVGMSQGKFSIQKNDKGESMVVPDLKGLAFASTAQGQVTGIQDHHSKLSQSIKLSDLRTRLTQGQTGTPKTSPQVTTQPKDTNQ